MSRRFREKSSAYAQRSRRRGLGIRRIAGETLLLVQFLVISAAATQSGSVDFAELTQALRAFQEKPSAETAASVRALLPREGQLKFDDSAQARAAREALDDGLPTLEAQVEAVDRDAIRLGFQLLAVADAPISKSLNAILGRLITTDARVFLEELLRWRTELKPRTLGQLVGTLGKEYVEQDHEAVCEEIQRRIDALLAVNEAALTEARDECVNELRQRRPRCG
ncbi:MAG TPA: hypothetical protein DEP35_09975 [Deltaproteobacteria bacterium]|nr:hypothetical protein [Deltaproteobacteria bacterium]